MPSFPGSSPGWKTGYVPSATEWNSWWGRKLDASVATALNVLGLGALGNGVADDTVAIQNALNNYAGQATIYIPPTNSTYMLNTLNVPSKTDLIIGGTLRKQPNTTGAVLNFANVSNISIRGNGIIDGNGAAQSAGPGAGRAGINTSNVTTLSIRDITLQNAFNWNLNVGGSQNVLVDHVKMIGGGSANEFAAGCSDCWLTNCEIDGTNLSDYGFSFYGGVTNSGAIGNVVKNVGARLSATPPGIGILSDIAQPAPCSNIVIANNIIHDNNGPGISCVNPAGGFQTGIVISNNRLYNNCKRPIGSSIADIFTDNTSNLTVSGNQCSANGSSLGSVAGIYLGPNDSDVELVGNQIYNVGQGTVTGAGLWIVGASGVYASGNYIYDNQITPTMQYAVIGAAGAGNVFVGNYFALPFNLGLQSDTILANAINGYWVTSLPPNAVNDAAAAILGVPVHGEYRNGSIKMIRVT